MALKLHILSPEGPVLEMEVDLVTLPGGAGSFTVLKDHAPLITTLERGDIRYVAGGKEESLPIKEGFARVQDNIVTVCAEV